MNKIFLRAWLQGKRFIYHILSVKKRKKKILNLKKKHYHIYPPKQYYILKLVHFIICTFLVVLIGEKLMHIFIGAGIAHYNGDI